MGSPTFPWATIPQIDTPHTQEDFPDIHVEVFLSGAMSALEAGAAIPRSSRCTRANAHQSSMLKIAASPW